MTFARGWRDGRRIEPGVSPPYPATYDKWPYAKQVAYEEGRRAGAVARNHKRARRFDVWDYPPEVMAAISVEHTLTISHPRPPKIDNRRVTK
jgi:hypothetical protein